MSDVSQIFQPHLKAHGITEYATEYRFHPKRRWRFDIAFPQHRIAVEIEGGTWVKGRHTRAKGYRNDCEKYNEATRLGWQVYRFTSDMVRDGSAIDWFHNVIRDALPHKGT